MNKDCDAVGHAAADNRPGLSIQVATGIIAAMALVCAVMTALLVFRYVEWKRADSLNRPQLVELRKEFAEHPDREALKANIRTLDLEMRREYFDGIWRAQHGSRLLLLAAGVMFILMGWLVLREDTVPDVERLKTTESAWALAARQRTAIAVVAAVCLFLAIAAGLLARVWMPPGGKAASAAVSAPSVNRGAGVGGAAGR